MVGKGKSRRRLALMVALALSTGGGCLTSVDGGMIWGMSKAYAAETHDYTESATSISGLEGTDKTGFMSDNKITLGTEGGATDKPFSTYGTISGGGKKNATADVSNNTLTIHGLKVSNGGGQSMIYGGVSGTGAVSKNNVIFNNGLSKDPIYGGFNGATATKAVTGNSVTVAGGTVEGDAFGGVTQGTGAVTGNSVTITDGTLKDEAGGGVVTNASNSSDVTGNTLTISGGTFSKGNTNVYGAYTAGNGDVSGNTVAVSGGIIGTSAGGNIHGGYSDGSGTVSGNTVTISGGTLGGQAVLTTSGKIYGGYSGGTGKTINNVVNLGTAEGVYTAGTGMKRVEVYGGNRTSDVTGNALHVYAKGVEVEKIRNFESYNFHLTAPIKAGNTMLTLGSGNLGSGADWNKLNLDLSGWAVDTTKYGKIGTVTLMHSNSGSDIVFNNYAAKTGSSGDFEYNITATPSMLFPTRTLTTDVTAEVNRFQNVDATADNVTGTEVYGGYSSLGNTTTNNKIKITNTNNTNLAVYGGYTAGAGDSTNNHVTITATGKVKAAYGGYATAANSKAEGNSVTVESGGWVDNTSYAGWAKGAVNRNIFTVKGHADWSVYGGKLDGSGKAEGNEVRIEGGTVMGEAVGAKGNADSTVTGNKVVVTGGTVKKDVVGGQTGGVNGKATGNTVTIANSTVEGFVQAGRTADGGTVSGNQVSILDSIIKKGIIGGSDSANGNVTGNTITVSGGSTVEGVVYGGYSGKSGIVTDNIVTIADGTFQEPVYGGYSDKSGTVAGNKVTLTGGTFQNVIYGGAGGDPSATGTFTVNNNTVTIAGGTFSTNIYGGYSWKADGTTTGNTVNLGDDTHTDLSGVTLAASNIYGGNKAATGNTLNINAKNVTAKSADKFENYKFHLNDDIAKNGGSMLTLTENNGFNGGNLFDWTKLDVDTSKLSGSTVIGKATLLTGTANGLKFSNYAGRNKTTAATNGDYETALRTDTNAATATKVILDYNRFQNNANAMYDGSIPPTQLADGSTEVYGGISYAGNTTKNNHLTITNLQADLDFAYGGKTAALTGNTENNSVTVTGTSSKKIKNINGGYTGATNGTASANRVLIKGGAVTDVMGGAVSGANGSATDNEVTVEGGTVTNVIGGGGSTTAAGNMSNNRITITGGTVTGQIVGGDSRVLTSTSNNNTITLGGGMLTGAEVWGTSYSGNVLANTDAKIAGNTLNVKAKDGVTLKKVRNVEKFNFQLVDDTTKTAPLLNLTEAGGFGKVTADNSDVKVKWSNVTVDLSKVTTEKDAAKIQGKNTYILMRAADPTLKFSDYAARYDTYGGVYETGLRTNTNTDTAQEVLYDVNRFKDGRVTYTTTSTGEALGGYSAFGSTTEGNELTLTGVTGTLAAAYGGQTAGVTGDSANNKVTLKGTGTGSIINVYGGAITKAANSSNATATRSRLRAVRSRARSTVVIPKEAARPQVTR